MAKPWRLLVVGLAVVLCACGSPTTSSSPSTTAPRAGESELTALRSACGPLPPAHYVLGTERMVGNSDPLRINVPRGGRIVLTARFAQRHLGAFDVRDAAVHIGCDVDVPGPAGGPAAIVVARTSGSGTVISSTNDCSACADLPFAARITVPKG